ncbi:hypothetical protein Golob_002309, partial [Gossypium lobatum]|nr:hypothetical protein [Gossypium lobatum]
MGSSRKIEFEQHGMHPFVGLNTSDEESDEFLPWLERKARTKISSMLSIGKSAYGRTKKLNFYVWRSYQYIEVDKNWEIVWEHLLFLFNAGMDGGAVCYGTCFFGVIKYQLALLNITLTPVLKGSEALFVLSFIFVD